MAKAKKQKDSKEFAQLFSDIKRIIRSSRQRGGDTLPHPLRSATEKAVIHEQCITITDGGGNKVLVIPPHWIPLFERLERASFSRAELTLLDWSVFDEEHTPEKRSKEIVAWARGLERSGKKE